MTNQQLEALEALINKWVDEHCQDPDWPDIIVGNKTVEHMAYAARSVFEACLESQNYARREGFMRWNPAFTDVKA